MDFCQTAFNSTNERLNDTAVMKPEFHSEVAEKIFEVLTSGELAQSQGVVDHRPEQAVQDLRSHSGSPAGQTSAVSLGFPRK
jgi:hypothetical protein